jgi:hypothetical protein
MSDPAGREPERAEIDKAALANVADERASKADERAERAREHAALATTHAQEDAQRGDTAHWARHAREAELHARAAEHHAAAADLQRRHAAHLRGIADREEDPADWAEAGAGSTGPTTLRAEEEDVMTGSEDPSGAAKPTEQRGGAATGDQEAREKGSWAGTARKGVVPAELGGSDAPERLLGDDPELGDAALGQPARSEAPATQTGIDPEGGAAADATRDGGPDVPTGAEPDLKDAASGPRQVDVQSSR